MAIWMKSKGYQVITSPTGAEGVQAVKDGKVDMVFVDFKMPGMDGVEVASKIRQFNKNIPIFMVTAHADEALLIRQNRDLKISGFFSKVGDFKELDQQLDVVLRNLDRFKAGPAKEK